TLEDAQKVVQAIGNDKNKLQAFCDLVKLQEQMEKAEEKNDSKALEALIAKADTLEQQVGPEYEGIIEGLDRVDPNSAEAQKFVAVFNTLQEKCKFEAVYHTIGEHRLSATVSVGVAIADDSSLDLDTLTRRMRRFPARRAPAAIVSNNHRPKQTQTVAQHDCRCRIFLSLVAQSY